MSLETNRYTLTGTYIGQYIRPNGANLALTTRLPTAIGKGSRLAQAFDQPIIKSFISGKQLTFPSTAPFRAQLSYKSNGGLAAPTRLYKSNGEEVRRDKFVFVESTTGAGYDQVLILTEAFDHTATYFLDYQSTDRSVVDPMPFDGLREIRALGDQLGSDKYKEYTDFYIPMEFSEIIPNQDNVLNGSSLQAPSVIVNAGSGSVVKNTAAIFNHQYNRHYSLKCVDAQGSAGSRKATFQWISTPVSGGNFSLPPSPLHPLAPANEFIIDETVPASSSQELEFGIKLDFAMGAGNFIQGDEWEFLGLGPALFEVDVRHLNTNETTEYGEILKVANGTGSVAHAAGTSYVGKANVGYSIQCIASSGGLGARQATFVWASYRELGATGTFTITEGNVASLTQNLSLGIQVKMAFGAVNFSMNDLFSFIVNVPFQHVYFKDDRNYQLSVTSANSVSINSGNLEGQYSTDTLEGGFGQFTAEVSPFIAGTKASGTIILTANTFSANDGVVIGGTLFAADVDWVVGGTAAISAENLKIAINNDPRFVATRLNETIAVEYVSIGSEGNLITMNKIFAINDNFTLSGQTLTGGSDDQQAKHGLIELPNSVFLIARNLCGGGAQMVNNHQANDKHTFTTLLSDEINFALTVPATDIRNPINIEDVLLDVRGSITGVPNTYYSVLSFIPLKDFKYTIANNTNNVTAVLKPNSPYVYYSLKPNGAVSFTYRHKGNEPDTGNIYYISANYLRPTEFYNSLQVVRSRDEGRRLLGPASLENDLYNANEIAWKAPGNLEAVGFVQVYDQSGSGVFSKNDYEEAITSVQGDSRITDWCLLNKYEAMPFMLSKNVALSDPFELKGHLVWIGMPINTPIGSVEEPGSLVYTAKTTLQVYGDSYAHGTRILTPCTYATQTITLQDGTTATITMDGSFVAFHEACKVAAFSTTRESVLKTQTTAFDTMQEYDESQLKVLGEAATLIYKKIDTGIYEMLEDVTVDKYAPDFSAISSMVQKQDVTKAVIEAMNLQLIGLEIASGEEGALATRDVLVRTLGALRQDGRIAKWQDDNGKERPLSIKDDIRTSYDKDNPTLFRFHYVFFTYKTIKRAYGVYSVDVSKLSV